jgi:hypothetical protein
MKENVRNRSCLSSHAFFLEHFFPKPKAGLTHLLDFTAATKINASQIVEDAAYFTRRAI